jgi:hypothetical protein
MEGDIVVYRDREGNPCHVGVVFRREVHPATATIRLTVLSKWGPQGEYLHERRQLPMMLLGESSIVMSERTES